MATGKYADVIDWSSAVPAIQAPSLIVVGDADGMSNAHLAILPATTHATICDSPLLPAMVASFLDAPMPTRA